MRKPQNPKTPKPHQLFCNASINKLEEQDCMASSEIKVHDSFMESPVVNFISPRRDSNALDRADPAAGPFAGKRYSHAEYDIISNKGSA